MNNIDVFISYRSTQTEIARNIRTELEKNGFHCWLASDDLKDTKKYLSMIPDAISSCKFFLLIASEDIEESVWIPKELDTAVNHEKIIIPLCINNSSKSIYPFYLSGVKWYDNLPALIAVMKKLHKKSTLFTKKWSNSSVYNRFTDQEEFLSLNTFTSFCAALMIICISIFLYFGEFYLPFIIFILTWNDLIFYTGAKLVPRIAARDNRALIVILSIITAFILTIVYFFITLFAFMLFYYLYVKMK